MKKYIIAAGVFLLITGVINAGTVNKKGTGNAVTAISNSSASAKISGSAGEKKTGSIVVIAKIKHHHKRHHKHLHHR